MDKSQRGSSGWNQGDRDDDSGKPQYTSKAISRKKMSKSAARALNKAFRSLNEAKATYCGRCGTTHVPPSKGGTCPALKEEVDYDRHFSRQSKEVQTKINHHLRQGADYPTAARKAGATALKVGKMNEGVVARAGKVIDKVIGPAGSTKRQAVNSYGVGVNTAFDVGNIKSGVDSGSTGTLAAAEAGTSKLAQKSGQWATSLGQKAATTTSRAAKVGLKTAQAGVKAAEYGSRAAAGTAQLFGQHDSINRVGQLAKTGLKKAAPVAARVAPRATSAVSGAAQTATKVAPRATKFLGTVAKGALGKLAVPVAVGMTAYDAYKGYNSNPRASTSQKLKNAGINALSGLTFGLSKRVTGEMKESTTHGNGKMKTLSQFMAEANANRYVEEEEELTPEMQAIFDAINEAVGDRELSEEEFNEIFNYVVENLESDPEEQDDDELDEATTAQDYLRNLPKKPGGGMQKLPYPIKPGEKPSGGIKKLPYPIKPGEKPAAKLAPLEEAHDIELKPHPKKPGTHYVVHKINDKSIGKDQLKTGETLNDTHVDDLKDMGYSVKVHKD